MKKLFFLAAFFLFFVPPAGAFTLSNFDTPESMVVDPEDGSYYVSNINGSPTDKDGNGYISRINASGTIVVQKFIEGKKDELVLNAPKGMVIVGDILFVTDIDTVKGFNKKTRKPAALVDLSAFNAKFLNDIAAAADGNLYVSDMFTDRIFKIDAKKDYDVSVYKESSQLGGPNGLVLNPKTGNLIVVTWRTGEILEIDHTGKIHVLKRSLETLDGVSYDKTGNLYVSSFEKGEVLKIPRWGRGPVTAYLSGLLTPADISFDRQKNDLLVPSFRGNKISTFHQKI